jgi:hypothetical protein
MTNTTCTDQNLNVKHVATLFEEVQNRYVKKLTSIDEKHIAVDERHKVYDLSVIKYILVSFSLIIRKTKKTRIGLLEKISEIQLLCRCSD